MDLQGFRCEGCLADSHCYHDSDTSICHCACPPYYHMYSAKNHDALCGQSYGTAANGGIANDWLCVTCPVCLSLQLPDSPK